MELFLIDFLQIVMEKQIHTNLHQFQLITRIKTMTTSNIIISTMKKKKGF
jgi:hypothetical protein